MADTTANNSQNNGQAGGDGQEAAGPQTEAQESTAQETASTSSTITSLKEVDEWKNKVVYLTAEIDNMRKRFAREKSEIIRLGNEDLIQRLLPVVDNLELAVKAVKSSTDTAVQENPVFANLSKGVEMTLRHFEQTLEQVGAQPIQAVGKAFDPAQHEAVGQAQSPDFENDHVASEVQRGWTLNGRVVRPARVLVNRLANS